MTSLYEATRNQHHACEAHPVGQRMSDGKVTKQEWADWLNAFRILHLAIDPHLPLHMSRDALLRTDLALLPNPRSSNAATALAKTLNNPESIEAAAYVLHGAHRRGGRVLASKMSETGLPHAHIVYALPNEVETLIKGLRPRLDLAEDAKLMFNGMLTVMDEIQSFKDEFDV